MQVAHLAEHILLHFLIGIMVAAAVRVILPYSGILDGLSRTNLLSIPIAGSLGAMFYSCGGSAVPLAGGLFQAGISSGALFAFLLAGPALRGKTLASLTCLVSKRAAVICLVVIVFCGSLGGYLVDWLWRWI
jgi:uncharacterized membrane protein YraQ (UPF0718 family)